MCENKNFIKIFDEQIAVALSNGGFSYIEEKINGSQVIYAFEETPEFMDALKAFYNEGNYQEAVYVKDSSLNF